MSLLPDPEQMLMKAGTDQACATGSSRPKPPSANQAIGASRDSLDRIAEPTGARLTIGVKSRCDDPRIGQGGSVQTKVALLPFNEPQRFQRIKGRTRTGQNRFGNVARFPVAEDAFDDG